MKTAVMTDTNSGITKQEADALGISDADAGDHRRRNTLRRA